MDQLIIGGLELTLPVILLLIWTLIWKSFGLWYSAKRDNRIIFILIFILNTAGILPILYLIYLRYHGQGSAGQTSKTKPKKKVAKKSIKKKK